MDRDDDKDAHVVIISLRALWAVRVPELSIQFKAHCSGGVLEKASGSPSRGF